jgi:diaminopimelate decarboxylase
MKPFYQKQLAERTPEHPPEHSKGAPPLTAKLAPWMRKLIEQPTLLRSWFDLYGCPLHVVVRGEFKRNVNDLLQAFVSRNVEGGLFFARKPNKLPWFVKMANDQNIGVDVASLEELQETLDLGVPPSKIIVTAIGKDKDILLLAINAGCKIVIDNCDELELVHTLSKSTNQMVSMGLRFSGFEVNGCKLFSRFGLPISDSYQIISSIKDNPLLNLEFLHTHLDRYDILQRACAARALIEVADTASKLGCHISFIDLGGGILVRYLDSEDEWNVFLQSLYASIKGEIPSFTYLNDGLGYNKIGAEIIGQPNFYPVWNTFSKERFITGILDHSQQGVPLHRELSQRKLKLFFEPGRCLLDNAGITLTKIVFRKRDTAGNLLLGTKINKTNVQPFSTEFCCDPIILSDKPRQSSTEGAFIVGNMCSEGDLIYLRKLQLQHLPQPGDIICFPNTAGYFAHHLETGSHGSSLPKNLLLDTDDWAVIDSI